MSSKGFICSRQGDKPGSDEVFCLKKERFGPGLTGNFSRFMLAVLPNAVYWILPKDADATATYKRQEVTFTLEGRFNGVCSR
jgi:hypothetical protein